MKFNEFLNEFAAPPPSSPELQTINDKSAARQMLQKVRGLRPGRLVDAEGNSSTTPLAPAGNNNDNQNMSMILKNDSKELVLVHEDENKNLFITYVNKQKMTKRTITIDARAGMMLKRFIR